MIKYKSELLNDEYFVNETGFVFFDSGVIYKKNEIIQLDICEDETKKAIHKIKNIFSGELTCDYPKNTIPYNLI